MENMNTTEGKVKKKLSKKIIIPLILLVVIIFSFSGLLVYSKVIDKPVAETIGKLAPEEKEYVIALDEFLVNLNSGFGASKQFLRINMALMYTDQKQTGKIDMNISLIRDLIISSLRDVTVENALEEQTMIDFKENAKKNINKKLGQDLIQEIYITDIIVK